MQAGLLKPMKHKTEFGDIDHLAYAHAISLLKSHKERVNYLSDLGDGYPDLIYLLSMQMGLAKTIASLPDRGERKKAWEELPNNSMKSMVYHRVVDIFKRKSQ